MRLFLLLVVLSGHAAAQTNTERADVRELRRDALVNAQEISERGQPPVELRLTLGVAYTDAESGERRWATPFQWRQRFNEQRSWLKFSGDGIVSSESDEGHRSGFANLNFVLGHQLAKGLRGWAGGTLASAGEVGSEHGRFRAGASYEHALYGPWSGQIEGQLVRFNTEPVPDESRVRRQLLGQLVYSLDTRTLVLGQLERAYRPGVNSGTAASLAYQQPVGRTSGGVVLGVATLTRGLSEGARDTTIELDASFRF